MKKVRRETILFSPPNDDGWEMAKKSPYNTKNQGGPMSEIEITVNNKLNAEKRDLNVYHHSKRSAYIISHNSSITLPLKSSAEGDYLHISIVSGPGNLEKDCLIDIPSWADFKYFSQGNLTISHAGDRTFLEIPPGPPLWQLKITRANNLLNTPPTDQITIGDCVSGN